MKTWWLKLYTLPDMRDQLFLGLICCLIHLILHKFFPDYEILTFLTIAGVILFPSMPNRSGFGNNLSFHEMTVPRNELKKAFLADFSIHLLTKFVVTGICIIVFSVFRSDLSTDSGADSGWIVLSSFIYELPLFVSMLFISRYIKLDGSFGYSGANRLISFSKIISFAAIMILIFSAVRIWSQSPLFSLMFLALGSCLSGAIKMYQNMFHQESKSDLWTSSKYASIGFAICSFILLISNFIFFNFEFRNNNVSGKSRSSEFVYWGRFAASLTTEDFILVAGWKPSYENVYRKAPAGYGKIPLNEIIGDNKFSLMSSLVSNGKWSHENYLWIANSLERHQYSDNNSIPYLKTRLLEKWPSDLRKPAYVSELSSSFERHNRSIASEKRLKKKAQILDRY